VPSVLIIVAVAALVAAAGAAAARVPAPVLIPVRVRRGTRSQRRWAFVEPARPAGIRRRARRWASG